MTATARPRPTPTAANRPQLVDARITDITPDPDNAREDVGDVSDLANSMAANGLLQPVVVRRHTDEAGQTRLIVVAGHRRLAAAQVLGWLHIPTIIRGDMRPDAVLAAMLVENGQRKDLDPIEEARALRRLKAQLDDCSDIELARRIGRPNSFIANRLMLLSLPVEEQEEIRAGHMSLTEAKVKARVASGRVRPGAVGRPAIGHLAATHRLSSRAKARCIHLQHSRGKGKGVGGIACGECWEEVIRADERDHLHKVSSDRGRCVLCDTEATA